MAGCYINKEDFDSLGGLDGLGGLGGLGDQYIVNQLEINSQCYYIKDIESRHNKKEYQQEILERTFTNKNDIWGSKKSIFKFGLPPEASTPLTQNFYRGISGF